MTMDEIRRLVDEFDRAYYAERCDSYRAARSALLRAVEGIVRERDRAESALAAARALVESEQAWGLQYGDARCIWCGASPADPVEVHGDGCEFGALVRVLASHPAPSLAPPCHCTYEAGDSPCPMHGMDEEPAPSPRSEAGRTEVGGNYWPSADEIEVPCPGWPDCEYVQNPPGHKHYAPSAPVPAESATRDLLRVVEHPAPSPRSEAVGHTCDSCRVRAYCLPNATTGEKITGARGACARYVATRAPVPAESATKGET